MLTVAVECPWMDGKSPVMLETISWRKPSWYVHLEQSNAATVRLHAHPSCMNSASGALAPSRVWAVRILSRRLVLEDMASRSLEPALAGSIVCSSMDSSREVYLFRLQKICMRQIFVECKPVQADRKDRLVNGTVYIYYCYGTWKAKLTDQLRSCVAGWVANVLTLTFSSILCLGQKTIRDLSIWLRMHELVVQYRDTGVMKRNLHIYIKSGSTQVFDKSTASRVQDARFPWLTVQWCLPVSAAPMHAWILHPRATISTCTKKHDVFTTNC
jgi:hypothetical protein